MNWINAKDRLPEGPSIIVAIMGGRFERGGDPIKDAKIVILRSEWKGDEWRTMDCIEPFYLHTDEHNDRFTTIHYWIPWQEFPFPHEMILETNELD